MRRVAPPLPPLPLGAAVLASLAVGAPPALAAGPTYFVDVSVRRSEVTDHRCARGMRYFSEVSTVWSASGSGPLDGSSGVLEVTRERWRFRDTVRARARAASARSGASRRARTPFARP